MANQEYKELERENEELKETIKRLCKPPKRTGWGE